MYTVGKLAKQYNLSRSTLLYYDKIGLLSPSERNKSNYRLYSEKDVNRLALIIKHREAGIPLEDIGELLKLEDDKVTEILSRRLKSIQDDIRKLKKQENMILSVLIDKVKSSNDILYDKKSWSSFLIDSGYSQDDLLKWHKDFESASSKEHELFLKTLGMTAEEIKNLRAML